MSIHKIHEGISQEMQAKLSKPTRSDGWGIQCKDCQTTSDYDDWMETTINGKLPAHQYQCPICQSAFKRTREGLRPVMATL